MYLAYALVDNLWHIRCLRPSFKLTKENTASKLFYFILVLIAHRVVNW